MTKAELIADLERKDFVFSKENETGGAVLHENLNIKVYTVNIFEVVGKVAKGRSVHIYVQNEGQADEKAWYKDREPEQTVKTIKVV